ncbi:MAG: LPS assembly lipoprotein LptE [Pirellulales bacterium]
MRLFATIVMMSPLLAGCASYQVGSESLYAPDVATVYVPMIESDSFRRDLGERLTEAVIKEIELKTPYKVVGTPDADSILAVKLLGDSRTLSAENSFDDPRLSESAVYSQVSWLNRRRLPMAPPQTIALPPELVDISNTALLVPEAGQSVASSQQQAIERLAQQIVGTMESPW